MIIDIEIMKAIFLTHPELLNSKITGGVQLCSTELLSVIKNSLVIDVQEYHIEYTRRINDRLKIKCGLENYNMYGVKKGTPALLNFIKQEKIEIVFINMASAIRYAKPVKEKFGKSVQVILLSHGNHSGDFLHLITKPLKRENFYLRIRNKCRLGFLLSTEAEYRVKYLDGVVTLSETEKQIENWMNAKKTLFFPRFLKPAFLNHQPDLNRIGFVARLDHPPNIQGLGILCDCFLKMNIGNLKIRLVGAPQSDGFRIAKQYPFIDYQGELSDEALEQEAATWSFFLNPVWWYSTGASTKLAKAISWGIPIATTTPGRRGYSWSEGEITETNSPEEMCEMILCSVKDINEIKRLAGETRKAAASGPELEDLTRQLEIFCIK